MTADVQHLHGPTTAVDDLMSADDRATGSGTSRSSTDDELLGIISIGDVVKHRISELEFERDQLDSPTSHQS